MSNGTHDPSDRNWQLMQLMLDQTNVYHNHKETMAHAGITVLLGLVAGMFALDKWPPWVQAMNEYTCLSSTGVLVFAFVAVWLLIHIFVRWQLRRRRWAALFSAAIERTLKKWASAPPSTAELMPSSRQSTRRPNKLLGFLDSLFPLPSALLNSDVSREGWPDVQG